MFRGELLEDGVQETDIDKRTMLGFPTWFRNHVSCIIFKFDIHSLFG
jgi:hypothetical protein